MLTVNVNILPAGINTKQKFKLIKLNIFNLDLHSEKYSIKIK